MMGTKLGELYIEIGIHSEGVNAGLKNVEENVSKASSRIDNNLVGSLKKMEDLQTTMSRKISLSAMDEYESKLAKINYQAQDTKLKIGQLYEQQLAATRGKGLSKEDIGGLTEMYRESLKLAEQLRRVESGAGFRQNMQDRLEGERKIALVQSQAWAENEARTQKISQMQGRAFTENESRILRQQQITGQAMAAELDWNQKMQKTHSLALLENQKFDTDRAKAAAKQQSDLDKANAKIKEQNKAFGEVGENASNFEKTLARIQRTLLAFAVITLGMKLSQAFNSLVDSGIEYNKQMETTKLGITSILMSQGEFYNSSGKAVGATEKFSAAMSLSDEVMKQLRIDNLQTIATFEQLAKTFQQTLAPALAVGFNVDQVRQFSVAMTQAAGAMGLPLDMMAEETRSMLRGTITPRATIIATNLGITNEQIRQYQGNAQGLFDFLMGKLNAFRLAGEASQNTFMGLASNLKDAFGMAAGEASTKFFDYIKNKMKEMQTLFASFDPLTKGLKLNEGTLSFFTKFYNLVQVSLQGVEQFTRGLFDMSKNFDYAFENKDYMEFFYKLGESIRNVTSDIWSFISALGGMSGGIISFINNLPSEVLEKGLFYFLLKGLGKFGEVGQLAQVALLIEKIGGELNKIQKKELGSEFFIFPTMDNITKGWQEYETNFNQAMNNVFEGIKQEYLKHLQSFYNQPLPERKESPTISTSFMDDLKKYQDEFSSMNQKLVISQDVFAGTKNLSNEYQRLMDESKNMSENALAVGDSFEAMVSKSLSALGRLIFGINDVNIELKKLASAAMMAMAKDIADMEFKVSLMGLSPVEQKVKMFERQMDERLANVWNKAQMMENIPPEKIWEQMKDQYGELPGIKEKGGAAIRQLEAEKEARKSGGAGPVDTRDMQAGMDRFNKLVRKMYQELGDANMDLYITMAENSGRFYDAEELKIEKWGQDQKSKIWEEVINAEEKLAALQRKTEGKRGATPEALAELDALRQEIPLLRANAIERQNIVDKMEEQKRIQASLAWMKEYEQITQNNVELMKLNGTMQQQYEAEIAVIDAKYQEAMSGKTLNLQNQALVDSTTQLYMAQRQLAEIMAHGSFMEGMAEGLKKVQAEMGTTGKLGMDAMLKIRDSVGQASDAFVDMVISGKASFAEMTTSILADIEKMILKYYVFMALFGKGMGSGEGLVGWILNALKPGASAFAGASATGSTQQLAGGGTAEFGKTYLVGEKGPEMFQPGSTGRIIPFGASTGEKTNVTVNIINQSGMPMETKQGKTEFNGKQIVTEIFLKDMMSHGPMAQMMKGMISRNG
jgi:hypothetical protein